MQVTFLGTGTSQGVPVIGCTCDVCQSQDHKDIRLRCSVWIETDNNSFVIDTGPDFRQQMLRSKVEKVDAVLFTHEHKDHTAGLDDVRAYNFKYDMDMPLYGNKNVEICLKRDYYYAFSDTKYPGVPMLDFRRISNEPFEFNNDTITPILVWHYKLPVFGYRIGDFTYITDAKTIDDEEIEKIKGSKVLVINALRKQEHLSHFNVDEALDMVDRIKPERAYFTHISHLLGKHENVAQELPPNVQIAYDELKIRV